MSLLVLSWGREKEVPFVRRREKENNPFCLEETGRKKRKESPRGEAPVVSPSSF